MIPTPEQIEAEIIRLECARAIIGKLNPSGEDNHDAIEGQIQVLRSPETITETVIGNMMDSVSFYVTDAMIRAREWLDGEYLLKDEADEDAYLSALSAEWSPAPQEDGET